MTDNYKVVLTFRDKEHATASAKRLYDCERVLMDTPPVTESQMLRAATCGATAAGIITSVNIMSREDEGEDEAPVVDPIEIAVTEINVAVEQLTNKLVDGDREAHDDSIEVTKAIGRVETMIDKALARQTTRLVEAIVDGKLDDAAKRRVWAMGKAKADLASGGVMAAFGAKPTPEALISQANYYLAGALSADKKKES